MASKASQNFADDVRMVRASQKLTQAELAERLGVEQATISRWENAKGEPTYESVRSILHLARKMNINVKNLKIFDDDNKENIQKNLYAAEYTIPITEFASKDTFLISKLGIHEGKTYTSPMDTTLTTVGLLVHLPYLRSDEKSSVSASLLLYNNDRSPFTDSSAGHISVVAVSQKERYIGKAVSAGSDKYHIILPNSDMLPSRPIIWIEKITHIIL